MASNWLIVGLVLVAVVFIVDWSICFGRTAASPKQMKVGSTTRRKDRPAPRSIRSRPTIAELMIAWRALSALLCRTLHDALHPLVRDLLVDDRDRRHAPLLAGPARCPPRRATLVLFPAAPAAVRVPADHGRCGARGPDLVAGNQDLDHRRDPGSSALFPPVPRLVVFRHPRRALLGGREDAVADRPHCAARYDPGRLRQSAA